MLGIASAAGGLEESESRDMSSGGRGLMMKKGDAMGWNGRNTEALAVATQISSNRIHHPILGNTVTLVTPRFISPYLDA